MAATAKATAKAMDMVSAKAAASYPDAVFPDAASSGSSAVLVRKANKKPTAKTKTKTVVHKKSTQSNHALKQKKKKTARERLNGILKHKKF